MILVHSLLNDVSPTVARLDMIPSPSGLVIFEALLNRHYNRSSSFGSGRCIDAVSDSSHDRICTSKNSKKLKNRST